MKQWLSKLAAALGAAIIATCVAAWTPLSDALVGRVKEAVGRADLRRQKAESIANGLSDYVFQAESILELVVRGTPTKETIASFAADYNKAISGVRTSEYSNRAVIGRYWVTDTQQRFETVMGNIRRLDTTIHMLNPWLENVMSAQPAALASPSTSKASISRSPADQTRPAGVIESANEQLKTVQTNVNELLGLLLK